MPGYIAESKVVGIGTDAAAHDLAVLTLSRPLHLNGDDARAAYLPSATTRVPSSSTRLVIAGFGDEKATGNYTNGTLNEVVNSTVATTSCTTNRRVLCAYATTATCWGDSGSGAVEPGPNPTVVGILSASLDNCQPDDFDLYAALTAPTTLRFIKTAT